MLARPWLFAVYTLPFIACKGGFVDTVVFDISDDMPNNGTMLT